MRLYPTGTYPCYWDDLLDDEMHVIATIYAHAEAQDEFGRSEGIFLADDGVYEILTGYDILTLEYVALVIRTDFAAKVGEECELVLQDNPMTLMNR